jgi:hypothetical protein
VKGEEKEQKSLVPTKTGPLSYVLFEPPFTSVSTVSRGHPSLVSAFEPYKKYHSRFEKYLIYFVIL